MQENKGVVQRVLQQLLENFSSPLKDLESMIVRRRSSGRLLKQKLQNTLTISFLEIYNELIFDLLAPSRTQVTTKPDGYGGL